jgi:diketogulonate reductase-like aldo/keto reductase
MTDFANGAISRREMLGAMVAAGLTGTALPFQGSVQPDVLSRKVPSSGELLPVIGLGSWITFNVGDDRAARASCAQVIRAFIDGGGRVIDSSPMYGSSQSVIGEAIASLPGAQLVFAADKVWTSRKDGRSQIEESRRLWRVQRLDLVQVHNLLGWEEHLPMLFALKRAGRIRYVGISTSEGRRHADVEQLMRQYPIDFVQLTYNAADREVENRLLPLAADRGIAVIVNRPFRQGTLVDAASRRPLPAWANEIECTSWAQLLLKYIVSHPAVTTVIPATTSVAHVRENLAAGRGRMPDERQRERIAAAVQSL